jgi:hypothetical protein
MNLKTTLVFAAAVGLAVSLTWLVASKYYSGKREVSEQMQPQPVLVRPADSQKQEATPAFEEPNPPPALPAQSISPDPQAQQDSSLPGKQPMERAALPQADAAPSRITSHSSKSAPVGHSCAEFTIEDFEGPNADSWCIPEWSHFKEPQVSKQIGLTKEFASKGLQSLRMRVEFPGEKWTAGYVEMEEYLDLSNWSRIAVDIYLPKDAPEGLKGNFCCTYGDSWTWAEQIRNVPLVPGEWTTVEVNIADGCTDWKKVIVDNAFRADIRKLDIRIISDKKPAHSGNVYIDNVRAY